MEDAGMSAEEESHPEQPLNNEEGNIRDGEFLVDLNESQDNKYELKRTMDELRSELRNVKEDNDRILKAQGEINTISLEKFLNEENDKNEDFDQEIPKTVPYNKRKGRNMEFLDITLTLQVKSQLNIT